MRMMRGTDMLVLGGQHYLKDPTISCGTWPIIVILTIRFAYISADLSGLGLETLTIPAALCI